MVNTTQFFNSRLPEQRSLTSVRTGQSVAMPTSDISTTAARQTNPQAGLGSMFSFRFPQIFIDFDNLINFFPRPRPQPQPQPVPQPQPTNPVNVANIEYSKLTRTQRETLTGLSDREIAVFHLWGRQMSTVGKQNGAIYNSVLDAIRNGKAADGSPFTEQERKLVQELAAKEQQQFGGFTGRLLDEEFFKVFQKITGQDISGQLANRPTHFAGNQRALFPQGAGSVDSDQWINAISSQSGLNNFEQSVLRMWGHDPLFSDGKITGRVFAMTLVNPNSLDKGNINKQNAESLLKADMVDDGQNNGSVFVSSFSDVLMKLYFGAEGTNANKVQNQAVSTAQRNGRTMQQIQQDLSTGVQRAINDFKSFAEKHPILLTGGALGMMGAVAACPFCAGLGAAAAVGAMASRMPEAQAA